MSQKAKAVHTCRRLTGAECASTSSNVSPLCRNIAAHSTAQRRIQRGPNQPAMTVTHTFSCLPKDALNGACKKHCHCHSVKQSLAECIPACERHPASARQSLCPHHMCIHLAHFKLCACFDGWHTLHQACQCSCECLQKHPDRTYL
jgi:hypothetical protein